MARVIEQSGGRVIIALDYGKTESTILHDDYIMSITTSEAFELYVALSELELNK